MPIQTADNLITEDGTAYIIGTPVRVMDIVRLKLRHGMTPEALQAAVPLLSLAQVKAAIAYYYAHRQALDTEIESERIYREQALHQLQSRLPAGANWLREVVGKWPGDESDAEIATALENMS